MPVLAGVGVAGTATLALGLTVGSLGWPLVHDAPIMHYVAARLLGGATPYRDFFDMNFPGVYLVHALGLALLGGGDAGFRALDLLLLGGTVAGLAVTLVPFGRGAVAAGAVLFWLYHVAGGAWRAGQRDLILCLPLAWMTAAALADVARPRLGRLALAGAALGAAVWIKPHALLLLPLLAALAWRRPPGSRAAAVAALAGGIAAPAAGVVGWLAAAGALPAFLDIVWHYLVPLYSRLGRTPVLAALLTHDVGPPIVAGLGLWAVGGGVALWRGGERGARLSVLAAGVLYGALHFVVQGKGWEYHLYPLALFAVALGAAGFGTALAGHRPRAAGALLLALVLTAGALGAKGSRNVESDWIRQKHARALAVAAALEPVARAGRSIQVLDTTDGGVHALYLLRARQPTRFLYDFHFYHDVEHPYVRRLRAELLAGLTARPPGAVVLFERGWPRGDYERLRRFPELAAWLAAGYHLVHEGDGYRLYLPVAPSPG